MAMAMAGLAVVLLPAVLPAAAEAPPAGGRREAVRSALRTRAVDSFRGRTTLAAEGPVQAAAAGDLVAVPDPIDATGPRGDIREVGVRDSGEGRLRFTMLVEEYTDPATDPGWVDGSTGAFWGLDTSGDGDVEVVVDLYNDGTELVAEVFDATSGAVVCEAGALSSTGPAPFMAEVFDPACFGDTKNMGIIGLFVYDDVAGSAVVDVAPNDYGLVRFARPLVAGRPLGGYAIATSDGVRQHFGAVPLRLCPDPCLPLSSGPIAVSNGAPAPRIVGTASARPFDPGLWRVTDTGLVITDFGAEHHGDAVRLPLSQPIVGMAVLPDRSGYWLVARDGGIFSYGEAAFRGSMGGKPLNKPIVGMAATPTGLGYWLVASDGGIFSYGDAAFRGSMGGRPLNKPIVGMAPGLTGRGYRLVASDGGIFSFGLPFYGSTGGITLQQPIVGMATTRSGGGYRFVARDGGIFSYGDAGFHGSAAAPGRTNVVGIATA